MKNEAMHNCITDLRRGDREAFAELYRELKTPVYTIIYRIVYDRAQAEDVMQEVFLRLFRSPPDPGVQNLRAWIFRMARNLAIDCRRKPIHAEITDELEDTVHPKADAIVLRLDIEAALRALSSEDREIVTLHLNAGLKFREIAEIVSKPLGTVLWRYRKAIGDLRKMMS